MYCLLLADTSDRNSRDGFGGWYGSRGSQDSGRGWDQDRDRDRDRDLYNYSKLHLVGEGFGITDLLKSML